MMYKKEVGQILGSDQLLCVWGEDDEWISLRLLRRRWSSR